MYTIAMVMCGGSGNGSTVDQKSNACDVYSKAELYYFRM